MQLEISSLEEVGLLYFPLKDAKMNVSQTRG